MILSKDNISSIEIDDLIQNKIQNRKLSELLLIIPTNRRVRYLKRELISLSPDKTTEKLNLHTLSTFCTEIITNKNPETLNLLSEASSAVLLNKAFESTALEYFSHYKNGIPAGTLDRIKNVISEYKRNGITPEILISESEKLNGSEKLKAIDISNVFNAYSGLCDELNAFEIGDIYKSLLSFDKKSFNDQFLKVFPEVDTIIINGFDEFTQPEIEIINLISEIENVRTFLIFDYFSFNPSLFSHLDDCYEKFKRKGFLEVHDLSKAKFTDYLKIVRENLFSAKLRTPNTVQIDFIKIEASTPEKEIELIAKEIKILIAEKKVDPAKICVVYNLISDHSSAIRDIFSEYGIPFNLTDRFPLSESQPIIAIINLLEILENDFYYKNIFRALSNRWIYLDDIDLSNLLRVSSNLKIVSGYNNWIESINNAISELEYADDDDAERFLSAEFYEKAKSDIQQINKFLKDFQGKRTIEEFKDSLGSLIVKSGITKKLANDQTEFVEKNIKAVTTFLQTVNEFFELLLDEYGENEKFSLGFYLNQLRTALKFTRYNVKEKFGSSVLVTSVNEIRGLSFDYVFAAGMVDGEFPTRYQPEIFFSGSFRKNEYKHILEERYHFYQTLCTSQKSVYLSYTIQDDRKELTVSSFIKDFEKILCTKQIKEADYEKFIFSKSELLKISNTENFNSGEINFEEYGIDKEQILENIKIDELRRVTPPVESVYNGFIDKDLSDIAKERLYEQKQKIFSATQLEEYGKCPFQYFLKRILKLETIEEPTEELEAFELGSIIHSILSSFYKKLIDENIVIQNCNDETFKKAEKIIFEIAEQKFERISSHSPQIFLEKEKVLGISGKKHNSILYRFLEAERSSDSDYLPQFLEQEFGFTENEKSIEIKVDEVKVRGKIDRLDISDSELKYKVLDYKLGGKRPTKNDLTGGISLQIPLYVYASKLLLSAQLQQDYTPVSAEIYSLKFNKKEFGRKEINLAPSNKKLSDEEKINLNNDLMKIAEEFIPEYVRRITAGIFNLTTLEDRDNKVCNYCDFKTICRIQERA